MKQLQALGNLKFNVLGLYIKLAAYTGQLHETTTAIRQRYYIYTVSCIQWTKYASYEYGGWVVIVIQSHKPTVAGLS